MNQETNNRFEQALKDISKPEQHIREHVIIVSAFPQAETRRRFVRRWKKPKLQRRQVQLNPCTIVKNCCEKMNGRWGKAVQAGRPNYAGVRYFAGSRRGNSFRIYQRRNETRNFESSVDGISTINYSWMRHTKGSSKRYPNDKDYQRLFVVCTLAVGNRFPVAGFYENEDK